MVVELGMILILSALMAPPIPDKTPDAVEIERGKCFLCKRTKKKHKGRDCDCRDYMRDIRSMQLIPATPISPFNALLLGDIPQMDGNDSDYSSENEPLSNPGSNNTPINSTFQCKNVLHH